MKLKLRKFSGSALLAFAMAVLPALSHATSIDATGSDPTSISSGNFISGTVTGTPANGNMLIVSIIGSLGTFSINTGTLSQSGFPGLFEFTGGSLIVTNAQGVFHDTLTSGFVTSSGTGSFTIGGFLQPTPTLISGSTSFDFGIANDVVNRGNAGVNFTGQLTPVPEPGTLELFGSGLIGFAGLVRRKHKVGK